MCRDVEPRCLTKEHKPSDVSERDRIEAMGGQVTRDGNGRSRVFIRYISYQIQNTKGYSPISLFQVNHRLAMSRSIGDFDLKPLGVVAQVKTHDWL